MNHVPSAVTAVPTVPLLVLPDRLLRPPVSVLGRNLISNWSSASGKVVARHLVQTCRVRTVTHAVVYPQRS